MNSMNNLLEVKLISEKKGRGVFAKNNIAKGKTIDIAHILLISNRDWNLIEDTILSNYSFEWDDPKYKNEYETSFGKSHLQTKNITNRSTLRSRLGVTLRACPLNSFYERKGCPATIDSRFRPGWRTRLVLL